MAIPPKLLHCDNLSLCLTNGDLLYTRSAVSDSLAASNPELLIKNNLPAIHEAAIETALSLITASQTLELFSLDEVFTEALNRHSITKDINDATESA